MPPRAAKRATGGRGRKRAVWGRRRAAEAEAEPLPEESNVKATVEEEEEEVVEEEVVELKDVGFDGEKPPVVMAEREKEMMENEEVVEKRLEENRDASEMKDDDAKEPVCVNERDERLPLEEIEQEPESEPEEDGDIDYDEKEIEQDPRFPSQDPQEEGDEVEEEPEEAEGGEEEEGDIVEEEMEGMREEPEHGEGDECSRENRAKMVDTAEEVDHQEVVKERRKRKEFEIFVGGLDKDATENDLREVFAEVGDIIEVRLMMNPQTKKNKGFAFLRFATAEQAKQACVQLKNPVVHGKQCGVTPSQDSDTLFLGNICRTWTKEALIEKLNHYGVKNFEDLTLVEDTNDLGTNRGFAFIEFSSRSDAMDAFKHLQRRNVAFGVDRPAKVSFADSFIDPGDEIMAQVKTVFVDCLPTAWDEGHVKELLKQYGEIEKVELARNMPAARRKDFGFVTFDTHDAAVICARSINNEELGDGNNKAKVRARLSRPLQRSKGKNVARGDFHPGHRLVQGVRSVTHSIPLHGSRGIRPRLPSPVDRGFRRPANIRDGRPVMAGPSRSRPVAPLPRSYDRRAPVPPYPKSGFYRDYGQHEEPPPRSRAPTDYNSRFPSGRGAPYRDDYSPHGSAHPRFPRGGTSQSTARRAYIDDSYNQRYERQPLTYREGRGHEYESLSGSKRPYGAMDDVPPRYAETGVHHSRARFDYDVGASGSHYGDAYSDRVGRSNLEYGGSQSSLSGQDSYGLYSGRHVMGGYSGGSYGGSDVGNMYSSSYDGDYMSRGSNVGGSSYPSVYPRRSLGGNNYMGSSGSGSYY